MKNDDNKKEEKDYIKEVLVVYITTVVRKDAD